MAHKLYVVYQFGVPAVVTTVAAEQGLLIWTSLNL